MDSVVFWNAVVMGLTEGLTEFLPVSSTGHLILLGEWLHFDAIPGKLFEIVIQSGAILAVCVKYRAKLWYVARTLPQDRSSQRFAGNLLLAFLPAAAVGVVVYPFTKAHLFTPTVVAASLIAGGVAILLIERFVRRARWAQVDNFPPALALAIGVFQCVSMIPGVSRSGATIMGALLAGAERKAAAEFSFFLAIPTLAAACLYALYKNRADLSADSLGIIAVGFIVSFVSALAVVEWLIGFVSRRGFAPFAYYRIALGAVILWVV